MFKDTVNELKKRSLNRHLHAKPCNFKQRESNGNCNVFRDFKMPELIVTNFQFVYNNEDNSYLKIFQQ